jgi:hypothetical protein
MHIPAAWSNEPLPLAGTARRLAQSKSPREIPQIPWVGTS